MAERISLRGTCPYRPDSADRGFFEGIGSERGIAWRVADSLSLRRFLTYRLDEATPDHVTIRGALLAGVRAQKAGSPEATSMRRTQRVNSFLSYSNAARPWVE